MHVIKNKKLLFLLTEDWFFCSHFIERAISARQAGYDVVVVARENSHANLIRSVGLKFINLEFNRRSINPLRELLQFLKILIVYINEKPDLVHHVSAKPILYGTMAALILGVKAIVNAPVGMGYIFSSQDIKARFLRPLVRVAYRFLCNPRNSRVIFENNDDLESFVYWKAVRRLDAVIIRGAGIDLNRFKPVKKNKKTKISVVLVARMLRDKGIIEFVQASHRLYDQGVDARFILVGLSDVMNPTSIPESDLNSWNGVKGVEWLGWCDDVPKLLAEADIACLPSYREGLPKSLIEAAACGLPIVTTDTEGCREVVIHGENGFLVPVKDSAELSRSLMKLIQNPKLRETMGNRGREIAIKEFGSERIIYDTLQVYAELLGSSRIF